MNIALCLISTGKYKSFVQPLLNDVARNFLPNHQITIHLFTDEYQDLVGSDRVRIEQTIIHPWKFPEITLFRYRIFLQAKAQIAKSDYTAYLDVDMSVALPVHDHILQEDIIAIRHPGFWYNNGWGSGGVVKESLAYIEPEYRKKYFCGGFQLGKTDKYLEMCELLADNIDDDYGRGVIAEHNDESHWNAFCNYIMPTKLPDWKLHELTPEYCNVPNEYQRQMWQIDHLPMRVIALDKDHKEMRA